MSFQGNKYYEPGTDGSDFNYRQKVDTRYVTIAKSKRQLKWILVFQSLHVVFFLFERWYLDENMTDYIFVSLLFMGISSAIYARQNNNSLSASIYLTMCFGYGLRCGILLLSLKHIVISSLFIFISGILLSSAGIFLSFRFINALHTRQSKSRR